jgi:malonate transporter and related proteins
MLFESLSFAVEVTLPITIIIILGIVLKRIDWINDEFARIGSRLVFNLTLPCLLFVNIATTDLSANFPVTLVLFAGIVTSIIFLVFHFLAFYIPSVGARGAFVQGACRGNMAIIGLALSVNAFGHESLSLASMYLSVIVVLYNIYSILTLYYHQSTSPSLKIVVQSVLTNPLAIAILLAIFVALLSIKLPSLVIETGNYIARMTLPLALLCVGASIRLQEFRASRLLYCAISSKVIIIPLLATVLAYVVGFRGQELGVLYIMMAAPTAAAAYPMVRTIGGDYHLTAAIIAGSTLFSMLTYTFGLFFLHYLQWV